LRRCLVAHPEQQALLALVTPVLMWLFYIKYRQLMYADLFSTIKEETFFLMFLMLIIKLEMTCGSHLGFD
jgi:hypothetical protein